MGCRRVLPSPGPPALLLLLLLLLAGASHGAAFRPPSRGLNVGKMLAACRGPTVTVDWHVRTRDLGAYLTRAAARLSARGGGTLKLTPGLYRTRAPVLLPANVCLVGANRAGRSALRSVIRADGYRAAVVSVWGAARAAIAGVTVDANGRARVGVAVANSRNVVLRYAIVTGAIETGIRVINSVGVAVQDSAVVGSGGSGMQLNNVKRFSVAGSSVDVRGAGVVVGGRSSDGNIARCSITQPMEKRVTGAAGLVVTGQRVAVYRNDIDTQRVGIELRQAAGVDVVDNTIWKYAPALVFKNSPGQKRRHQRLFTCVKLAHSSGVRLGRNVCSETGDAKIRNEEIRFDRPPASKCIDGVLKKVGWRRVCCPPRHVKGGFCGRPAPKCWFSPAPCLI